MSVAESPETLTAVKLQLLGAFEFINLCIPFPEESFLFPRIRVVEFKHAGRDRNNHEMEELGAKLHRLCLSVCVSDRGIVFPQNHYGNPLFCSHNIMNFGFPLLS